MDTPLVCTIGHSNRSIGTFIELLEANKIVRVLDVRTVPRSRHNPQFNRDTLAESLGARYWLCASSGSWGIASCASRFR